MKTSNLIITFGLCSLLLSPASIFGMEKFNNEKIDETPKTVIFLTNKPPIPQRTNRTVSVPQLTQRNKFVTSLFDAYRGIKGNVVKELEDGKFDNTSNPGRVHLALNKCFACRDYMTLAKILKLCDSRGISIANINIIDQSNGLLEATKMEGQKAFNSIIDKNYIDGSKLLNKNLEDLKKYFTTRIKVINKMMLPYIDTAHTNFEKHDRTMKQVDDALSHLQKIKVESAQNILLECIGKEKKKDVAAIFNKFPKGTRNEAPTNNFKLSEQIKSATNSVCDQLKIISEKLNQIPPVPVMKAIADQ